MTEINLDRRSALANRRHTTNLSYSGHERRYNSFREDGLPLIIYHHTILCESYGKLLQEVQTVSKCKIFTVDSLPSLTKSLSEKPTLVLIHSTIFTTINVGVHDIVNMLLTCNSIMIGSKLNIGVVIDKSCPISLIKELQETEILGIVPGVEDFDCKYSAEAFRELLLGHSHWPKLIIDQIAGKLPKARKINSIETQLTIRQQQVLDLVCNRGLPNKAIANILKISASTVKIHVSHIMKAYGVRNRTQLALAVRLRLTA